MSYRLQLQGRWTENAQELEVECASIKAALAFYGMAPIGYDPGVIAVDAEHPDGDNAVAIPLWLLKRLIRLAPIT